MPKYSIYAVVECGKYLGEIEADSDIAADKQAVEFAINADISTCHFSASEIEPKLVKVIAKAL